MILVSNVRESDERVTFSLTFNEFLCPSFQVTISSDTMCVYIGVCVTRADDSIIFNINNVYNFGYSIIYLINSKYKRMIIFKLWRSF